MNYFGSIYFNMADGLVCGLKNVLDDKKVLQGQTDPQFYRQAELSFVPLHNIKKVYPIQNNFEYFIDENDYNTTDCDGYLYKDLKAKNEVGYNSTMFLLENQDLYVMGSNEYGESGIEKEKFIKEPTLVPIDMTKVKKIVRSPRSSKYFMLTYFLMNDGTVKGCGKNVINSDILETIFFTREIRDCGLTDVKDIFVTDENVFFVKNDGIYVVGNNDVGQAGIGDVYNWQTRPTYINKLTKVKNINPKGLVDIVGYYTNYGDWQNPLNIYSNKLGQYYSTIFIYENGNTMVCGNNAVFKKGNTTFYAYNGTGVPSDVQYSPVLSNLNNVRKIQNEFIMYKDGNTNFSDSETRLNNIKDFYSYDTKLVKAFYFIDVNYKLNVYLNYKYLNTTGGYDENYKLNFITDKRGKLIKNVKLDPYSHNYEGYDLFEFKLDNIKNWTLPSSEKHKFKAELWKNFNQYLCDIPKEYIEKISYKINLDLDTFDITIPKFISGTNRINPIYNLIQSRQQILITDINNVKQRFILKEADSVFSKSNGSKTFKAYSLEQSIMKSKYSLEENYYCLYSDSETNGILNNIFKNTPYEIGCIDLDASKKYLTSNEIKTINSIKPDDIYKTSSYYVKCVKGDVKYNDILYTYHTQNVEKKNEGDVVNDSIPIKLDNSLTNETPLTLTLVYNNVIVGEIENKKTKNTIQYGTQYINFDSVFYDEIISIQAIVWNQIGNRNAIKHIITMKNGDKKEFVTEFVKCTKEADSSSLERYITWDSVDISFTTGKKVTQKDLLYLKQDTVQNAEIQSALSDICDSYCVYFKFDTVNKFVHCFATQIDELYNTTIGSLGDFILGKSSLSKKNYLNRSNIELTIDDITKISLKENDESMLTGLRVSGKDDLSIINVNPLGSDVIENYDYFINNNLLSDNTIAAYKKYTSLLKNRSAEWDNYLKNYNRYTTKSLELQSQLEALSVRIQAKTIERNEYTKSKNITKANACQVELDNYSKQYENISNKINNAKQNIDLAEEYMSNYFKKNLKDSIVDENGNKVFTWDELQELYDIENIEDISDNYFTDSTQLYENYKEQLEMKVKGRIDITTENNNMIKYYTYTNNPIRIGCIYDLEKSISDKIGVDKLKLIEYEYYPNKDKMGSIENLVFSNKEEKVNLFKAFKKNAGIVATQKNTKAISQLNSSVSTTSSTISTKLASETYTLDQANLGNLVTTNFRVASVIKKEELLTGEISVFRFSHEFNKGILEEKDKKIPLFDVYVKDSKDVYQRGFQKIPCVINNVDDINTSNFVNLVELTSYVTASINYDEVWINVSRRNLGLKTNQTLQFVIIIYDYGI